jgi:hypothetical protein
MGIVKIIERMCVQTAVYWENPVADGFGGINYDEAKEIKCRWENKRDLIVGSEADAPGEELISEAQVYILEDLQELGYLYLGTLNDLDSDAKEQPETISTAFQIKKFEKTPAFKSTTDFLRKAYL